MQGYGPLSLTPGTVVGQPVDPQSDRIWVSNRSGYDVLVSFQAAQPIPASQCSLAWPVIVHPGDHIIFTLRAQDRSVTPLGTYWTGQVWYCPISSIAPLALNGTVTNYTALYIFALQPGDTAPTVGARSLTTDISSQTRVISVPIVPQFTPNNIIQVSTGTIIDLISTAGLGTPLPFAFYLHSIVLTCNDSTVVQMSITVQVQRFNALGAQVGPPTTLMSFTLSTPYALPFTPAQPLGCPVNASGGTTTASLQLNYSFVGVSNVYIGYSAQADIDAQNLGNTVPGIGAEGLNGQPFDSGGFLF